jgi:predicted Zn-dependent protease with MMP-like domain
MARPPRHPPSEDELRALAEEVLAAIPAPLRRAAGNVAVQVTDFADDEVLDDMELDSPFDLMGLYQGVAMTERSVSHPQPEPDMVFLYRRPLLDYWCETGADLAEVVRYVLIHEIGHHFGYSDDEMDALQGEP